MKKNTNNGETGFFHVFNIQMQNKSMVFSVSLQGDFVFKRIAIRFDEKNKAIIHYDHGAFGISYAFEELIKEKAVEIFNEKKRSMENE